MSVEGPNRLTVTEAAARIQRRDLSPVALTQAVLDRIEAADGRTKAYVLVLAGQALAAAQAAEQAIAAGDYRGPLHGIPVAIKDICDLAGVPTGAGSPVRASHVAAHDSTVVARLRQAGAVLIGKTRTHEFAYGTVTPPTRNPWNLDHIPGGSSGGSGAAVAADECLAAIGSDTGGSIRIPAALNGIVGLKPTYGRVSLWGLTPLAWSLDHPGPLVKRVADAALVLQAIAGPDPRDPITAPEPVPDFGAGLHDGAAGLKLGVPRNYYFDDLDPEVARAVCAAIDHLRGLGAEVHEVTIPTIEYAFAVGRAIVRAEASSYHQTTLREQPDDYGPGLRHALQTGELVLATHYLKAQRARVLIQRGFQSALRSLDALLAPTVASPAPRAESLQGDPSDPAFAVIDSYVRFAYPANLTGLPALSVPCGFTESGLPIGLQIIGRPFAEATVLRIGQAYEATTPWHERKPEL